MPDIPSIDDKTVAQQFKLVFRYLDYNIQTERDAFDVLMGRLTPGTKTTVETEMVALVDLAIDAYDARKIDGLESGFQEMSLDSQQGALMALANLLPDSQLKTDLLALLQP